MPKCDFNKVAKQLRHGCSPVNLLHIFRTPFSKNTSGWLLLNFEVRYSFMTIFFGNRKILTPCCEVFISRSAQRCSAKIRKNQSGKISNIPSKRWYKSGFILSTTNCIFYISLASFWHHFNHSIKFRTRYAQIQFDPILAIMKSELGLEFQSL